MKNRGRNDKCVCGSGKKFKKCCIDTGSPWINEDFKLGEQRVKEYDGENPNQWIKPKCPPLGQILAAVGMESFTYYPKHRFP